MYCFLLNLFFVSYATVDDLFQIGILENMNGNPSLQF